MSFLQDCGVTHNGTQDYIQCKYTAVRQVQDKNYTEQGNKCTGQERHITWAVNCQLFGGVAALSKSVAEISIAFHKMSAANSPKCAK